MIKNSTGRTPWPKPKPYEPPSGPAIDGIGTAAILALLLTIMGLGMGWWG